MLDIYKLSQALTESSVGASSIPAYNFVGGLDEAFSEFQFNLISEQANYVTYSAASDEIMTEAAISNPAALSVLSENVFSTIATKFKSFIDKLISMVKGLWNKLKAYIYAQTGKTSKWLSLMRKKVQAASEGADKVTFEGHKWNLSYLKSGMSSGINSVVTATSSGSDGIFANIQAVSTAANNSKDYYLAHGKGSNEEIEKKKIANDDGSEGGTAIEKLDAAIEVQDEYNKNSKEKLLKTIAEKLGLTPSDYEETADGVITAVAKKATGGEKVTMSIADCGGSKSMLDEIDGASKSLKDIEKIYKNQVDTLTKMKIAADKALKDAQKIEDKKNEYASAVTSRLTQLIKAQFSNIMSEISDETSIVNRLSAMNKEYINSMCVEYMSALNKYVGYKKKKEA